MGAHTGRCFRALRRTKRRKVQQGESFQTAAIRQRVPLALRPFLAGPSRQKSAGLDVMNTAIALYAAARTRVGRRAARGT
jgi:hypothetical protein